MISSFQSSFQSGINRNLFAKVPFWSDKGKMDALVFKITVVVGLVAMFLPWGQA